MPLDQNSHQTVTRFGCVGFLMYTCVFSVLQVRQFCLFTHPPRSKWASSEKMIFFCQNRHLLYADHRPAYRSKNALDSQLASTPEPIELFMVTYQDLCAKFLSIMSPKYAIVENDGELMLMALHKHFLPQRQYSRVYTLFLAFQALVHRWGCQFLSLFSQDTEHMELTVLLFFQNPYSIFTHILQHYHDLQSNVAIFPSELFMLT